MSLKVPTRKNYRKFKRDSFQGFDIRKKEKITTKAPGGNNNKKKKLPINSKLKQQNMHFICRFHNMLSLCQTNI